MTRRKTFRPALLVLAVAIASTFLMSAAASAATVSLSGGSTKLTLDRGVASALSNAGVSVTPVAPARARGGGVSFPITRGRIDPATAAGRIDHSGGLRFAAGSTSVTARDFRVRIGKRRGSLSARIGKARVPLLILGVRGAKVTRRGFNTNVSNVRVHLTGTAAKALNRAFRTSLFRADMLIGKVAVRAVPAQVSLRRAGATSLALDPGAVQALTAEGIAATPVAPARAGSSGLSFPITGGLLNARTFAGTVSHSGGIALTKGSTRVELTRYVIRIDGAPDLTARVGNSRVSILSLDLSGLTSRVSGRRIQLGNVKASLTAAAAQALNQAFSTNRFREGLLLGTASVDARAR